MKEVLIIVLLVVLMLHIRSCNDVLIADFQSSDVIVINEYNELFATCVEKIDRTKITGKEFGDCLVTSYNLSIE